MKKLVVLAALPLLLAGCSTTSTPAPEKTVAYGLPANCDIEALLKLDSKYAVADQTADGVDDSRDCAIGVPNSDVGIFFGYSVRTKEQWLVVTAKLVAEGYKKWDAGVAGAEVWRLQSGTSEDGANCSLSGFVPGISFSVTEPWTACDDKWNKELVGHLVEHAKQK